MKNKLSRISLPLATMLSIAGCGGGDGGSEASAPADPLAAYKSQVVQWGSCDQYLGHYKTEFPIYSKLGDRLQCANIKAPLDYQKPDRAQISVAMMRVLAEKSPETKPNLFLNPGGPGGEGQSLSVDLAILLSDGAKSTALGQKYKEISDAYNFVGFSPRGVGASTNLICAGNELDYPMDVSKWGTSPGNVQSMKNHALYTAENCQKSPVSDYINTDATARDMDLMRHLLGDEKLHYYGISYGTWLGFWYAGLFPERVGPMVLDSSMNFNKSIHDASIASQEGQIHSFNEFIAPYAAKHDDVFGLGKTSKEVSDNLNSLGSDATRALLVLPDAYKFNFGAKSRDIHKALVAIKLAVETNKLIEQKKSIDEIDKILHGRSYIGNPDLEGDFQNMVSGITSIIERRRDPTFYTIGMPFSLSNEKSVFNTVVCNDEPLLNKDPAYWVETAFRLAERLPTNDTSDIAGQPCLYWKRQVDISKPGMDRLKAARLLMVQSEFDVPTPLKGARETLAQLPATSMVQVNGEGSHGLMVYGTECVDLTVMDYLLGKAPAKQLTECPGNLLPLDKPSSQVATLRAGSSEQTASNFQDPELAQQLIDRLRNASR
ncbi:alpha/beta fold hydrolase [Burkholderia anthina]|uniref:alpha/beta fold hydrolase n=1 Tax=Burkholderia anthina TaxID=179879 RepID=UPI00158AC939|nr:alpha/beta fold hydrolase [Burkholderia anthina]